MRLFGSLENGWYSVEEEVGGGAVCLTIAGALTLAGDPESCAYSSATTPRQPTTAARRMPFAGRQHERATILLSARCCSSHV